MRTMTGIQWTDDHIYRYVTREFPEEGDELNEEPKLDMGIPSVTIPEPSPSKLNEPATSKSSELAVVEA